MCPWLPRLGEAASLLLSQGTKGTRALDLSLLDKTGRVQVQCPGEVRSKKVPDVAQG